MPLLSTFQWIPFSFPKLEFFKTGYLLNVTYSVKNGPLAANQMFFASAGIKIRKRKRFLSRGEPICSISIFQPVLGMA
jgi:hypothetical protein